jgi:hypothetical protein
MIKDQKKASLDMQNQLVMEQNFKETPKQDENKYKKLFRSVIGKNLGFKSLK